MGAFVVSPFSPGQVEQSPRINPSLVSGLGLDSPVCELLLARLVFFFFFFSFYLFARLVLTACSQ